ncbi:hypothetical protein J7643_12250 [bacterium]|nr:hypothetical protein [bacterium]
MRSPVRFMLLLSLLSLTLAGCPRAANERSILEAPPTTKPPGSQSEDPTGNHATPRPAELGLAYVEMPRNSWTVASPMSHERGGLSAGVVEGELYAIGGDGESSLEFYDPQADSWRVAPTPAWSDSASYHDASSRSRYFGASIVSDGRIYYIGGTYDTLTPFIDVYVPQRQAWKDLTAPTLTNARYGRIGFAALTYNGAIFVIGGMMQAWGAASLASDDVCAFVPSTLYQYDETDLPQPRAGLGAAVLNHHLYVVGGYAKHAESGALQTFGGMLRYTPGEWTTTSLWGAPLASLNVPRHSFGTAELDGRLYVAGGVDAQGRLLDSVEEYDPTYNAWILKAPMSAPRAHLALVAFGDRLFALGGYDPAGRQSRGVEVFRP